VTFSIEYNFGTDSYTFGLIVSLYNSCVVNLNSRYRNEFRSENCLSLKLFHNDRHYLLVCAVKMEKAF
jgi:hypothetical protein